MNNIYNLFLIACKAGLYGFNCNETCGYCRDLTECVRFDGLCLTGCEVGYNGSTCKSGMNLDR